MSAFNRNRYVASPFPRPIFGGVDAANAPAQVPTAVPAAGAAAAAVKLPLSTRLANFVRFRCDQTFLLAVTAIFGALMFVVYVRSGVSLVGKGKMSYNMLFPFGNVDTGSVVVNPPPPAGGSNSTCTNTTTPATCDYSAIPSSVIAGLTNLTHTCFGVMATSSQVCSGAGTCDWYNQCTCAPPWSGAKCDQRMAGLWCNGVISTALQVCSGHGQCIGENICQCAAGFNGKNCENDNVQLARSVYFSNIEMTERIAMGSIATFDAFTGMLDANPAAMAERQLTMAVALLNELDVLYDDKVRAELAALGDVTGSTVLTDQQKGAVTGMQALGLRYFYNYYNFDQYTYLTGQTAAAIGKMMQSMSFSDFSPALDGWVAYYRACSTAMGYTQPFDCILNFNEPGMTTTLVDAAVENTLASLVAIRNAAIAAWRASGEPGLTTTISTGVPLIDPQNPLFADPNEIVKLYKAVVSSLDVDMSKVMARTTLARMSGRLTGGVFEIVSGNDIRMVMTADNSFVRAAPVQLGGSLASGILTSQNMNPDVTMLVGRVNNRPLFHDGNGMFYGYQLCTMKGVVNATWRVVNATVPEVLGTADPAEVYRIIHRPDPALSLDSNPLTSIVQALTMYTLQRDLFNGANNVTSENFASAFQTRMTANLGRPVSWLEIPFGTFAGGFGTDLMPALGWMFTSRLFEKTMEAHPEILADINRGNLASFNQWMATNVYDKVPLYGSVAAGISKILGNNEQLSGDALVRHFADLYNDLYGLNLTAPAMPTGESPIRALSTSTDLSTLLLESSLGAAYKELMDRLDAQSIITGSVLPDDPAARQAYLQKIADSIDVATIVRAFRKANY
jgi:Zn-dependent M32 family carboxypeptidase